MEYGWIHPRLAMIALDSKRISSAAFHFKSNPQNKGLCEELIDFHVRPKLIVNTKIV